MAYTEAFNTSYPALLSAYIQKNLVAKNAVNFSWEKDAYQSKTVKIRRLGSVDVYDYVADTPAHLLSGSAISFTSQDLSLDQAKYSRPIIDPILASQTNISLFNDVAKAIAYEHAQVQDRAIWSLYTNFTSSNFIQSGSSRLIVANPSSESASTGSAYKTVLDLKNKLDAQHTPKGDRYLAANSAFVGNLLIDTKFVQFNDELKAQGVIGKVAGFTVLETENIPDDQTNVNTVLAMHKSAITFATGLASLKPQEDGFLTRIAALSVYGLKVIEPTRGAAAFVRVQ